MIKSITVTNTLNESLELELSYPERSGFVVTNIEGLGPVKATVNNSTLPTFDGADYVSSQLDVRNIVFTLRYFGTDTMDIEDVRHLTYKYFPLKEFITIVVETDTRKTKCTGIVESNEVDIFSQEEGSVISVICPDPYMYSVDPYQLAIESCDKLFEFPFSNESLDEPLIVMGEEYPDMGVQYYGEIRTGAIFNITASNIISKQFTITNTNTGEVMIIHPEKLHSDAGAKSIMPGDILQISTVDGQLYAHLYRSGQVFNVLYIVDRNSDWIHLVFGFNSIKFSDGFEANIECEYSIPYSGI